MRYHKNDFKDERGIALVMTLLFLVVTGILATALVFTVQNEMKTSTAYKYSQQAFYVANAGVQRAVEWYTNSYTPHVPASDYDSTTLPVKYSGSNVLLAGQTGFTSTYPESSRITAFTTLLNNKSLEANENNTGIYAVNATLLKYRAANFINLTTFASYTSAIERWRLNSTGYWGTLAKPMGVSEITGVVENSGNALFDRALWGIDWVQLGGTVLIDSYDPAFGPYGGANIGDNGAIGSDGYITANGTVDIQGDVAYFDAANSNISSTCTVTGDIINLQEKREFPPIPSFTVGATNITKNSTGTTTINPGAYGTVNVKKGELLLSPGTYYFDSISDSANGHIAISGNTTIYVKTNLDLGGSGVFNPTGDPTLLTVYYSGTSEAKIHGNPEAFVEIYAPNAPMKLVGTSDFYGSFVGKTVTIQGTPKVHFDEGCLNEHLIQRPFRIINWSQNVY